MNQTSQQASTLDPGATEPARGRTVVGRGEMADRLRAHDWSRTSLGAIASWSETFLCAVNVMLACQFPSLIFWGQGMHQLYNDRFLELMAEKHPAALGQSCHECWEEAWHIIGPQLEAVRTRGESLYYENVLVPVLRGGKVRDVYWTYSYSPIFGALGEISGVLVICQDVTRELQARRERDGMAERLDQVLEATGDGVASMDRSWRLTYLNERAKTIVAANGDPTGKNLWETFPNAVFEGSPYVKHYHLAMDERVASEFVAFYPEPLNAWLKLVVKPSREGIVVFFRDVTEQKRAEAVLIQSEKLAIVERLASSIAHEINNPLESVTNLIYLTLTSGTLAKENREYLELAERELRRISTITNQTLSFQKKSLKPTSIFCHDLIDGGLSSYQGRILNSRVTVEKRKRALDPVDCFDGEIRQVMNNLLGNALDAMPPSGGRLLIRSREGTSWTNGERGLILTFADTGSGINPAIIEKIFDPFFSTKGIGGTGLGLWVSREIVARHRGAIRVRSSQRKGQSGTVFTLFLPFKAVDRPEGFGL